MRLGKATREAYGEALAELGAEDPRIVVLDADLSKSTMTMQFAKRFPDRFFNVGIAEANMVGIAAGMASCGKIPFVSSFACFLMCKAFDQLRLGVAYSNLNVKVVVTHGGISIGEDGVSQMSVEDVALACALPGFTVVVPADEEETRMAVRAAARHNGPVFIRTGRPKAPVVYEAGCDLTLGRAKVVRRGNDLTILANGLLVAEAIAAAEALAARGVHARVLDVHTVKPLDEQTITKAAQETGRVVVAEEHLLYGGLGSAVAMCLARTRPVPMRFVGLNDTYAESGKPADLMRKYGLTADRIVQAAEELL